LLRYGETTDMYEVPDTVPPIHAVSSHVATDKPSKSESGNPNMGSQATNNLQVVKQSRYLLFRILGPLHISRTVKASNLKFGMQIDHKEYL